MSTPVDSQPTKAVIENKDILRIKQKLAKLREKEIMLESLDLSASNRKRLQQSYDNLFGQVQIIQADVLDTYRAEFLDCRDKGHMWETKEETVEDGRLLRTLVCYRCQTKRDEVLSKYGHVISRNYTHSEGYLLDSQSKAQIGFNKNFWRGIQFLRATNLSH